jgi:hypothetical protein
MIDNGFVLDATYYPKVKNSIKTHLEPTTIHAFQRYCRDHGTNLRSKLVSLEKEFTNTISNFNRHNYKLFMSDKIMTTFNVNQVNNAIFKDIEKTMIYLCDKDYSLVANINMCKLRKRYPFNANFEANVLKGIIKFYLPPDPNPVSKPKKQTRTIHRLRKNNILVCNTNTSESNITKKDNDGDNYINTNYDNDNSTNNNTTTNTPIHDNTTTNNNNN